MVATDTNHGDGGIKLAVHLLQVSLLLSAYLRILVDKSVNKVSTDHKESWSRLHIVEDINTFLAQFYLVRFMLEQPKWQNTDLDYLRIPLRIRIRGSVRSVRSKIVHQTQLCVGCLNQSCKNTGQAFCIWSTLLSLHLDEEEVF